MLCSHTGSMILLLYFRRKISLVVTSTWVTKFSDSCNLVFPSGLNFLIFLNTSISNFFFQQKPLRSQFSQSLKILVIKKSQFSE